MTAAQIKEPMLQGLRDQADALLAEKGFRRSAKSLTYLRSKGDAEQTFAVSLAVRPPYCKDALAHVYPRVGMSMAKLTTIAASLVEEHPILLANHPEILLNSPLDHLLPAERRFGGWYAHEMGDFQRIVTSMAALFNEWAVPFYEKYCTPADIVMGYENGDERLGLKRERAIFAIAAYIATERKQDAWRLAETEFASPGLRRKLAPVIERLRGIVGMKATC